jgi:hypothetical protein
MARDSCSATRVLAIPSLLAMGGSLLFSYAVAKLVHDSYSSMPVRMLRREFFEALGLNNDLSWKLAAIFQIENPVSHGLLLFPCFIVAFVEAQSHKTAATTLTLLGLRNRQNACILTGMVFVGLALQAVGEVIRLLPLTTPPFLAWWWGGNYWYALCFTRLTGLRDIGESSTHLVVLIWSAVARLSLLMAISCAIAICHIAVDNPVELVLGAIFSVAGLAAMASLAFGCPLLVPGELLSLGWLMIVLWYLLVFAILIAFCRRLQHLSRK